MNQEIFKNSVFSLKDEMFRFAKSFLISSDEAQDLVQDMMLKFWQKKEELQALSNIKSYVLKSVRNECLNRLKHENVKKIVENDIVKNCKSTIMIYLFE